MIYHFCLCSVALRRLGFQRSRCCAVPAGPTAAAISVGGLWFPIGAPFVSESDVTRTSIPAPFESEPAPNMIGCLSSVIPVCWPQPKLCTKHNGKSYYTDTHTLTHGYTHMHTCHLDFFSCHCFVLDVFNLSAQISILFSHCCSIIS